MHYQTLEPRPGKYILMQVLVYLTRRRPLYVRAACVYAHACMSWP